MRSGECNCSHEIGHSVQWPLRCFSGALVAAPAVGGRAAVVRLVGTAGGDGMRGERGATVDSDSRSVGGFRKKRVRSWFVVGMASAINIPANKTTRKLARPPLGLLAK